MSLALFLLVSCGSTESDERGDSGDAPVVVTAQIQSDLDILWVVDNTASNAIVEPLNLGAPGLIDGLGLTNVSGPTVRIGMTTGDVGAGDFGIFNCEGNGDDGRLIDRAFGRCGISYASYLESRLGDDGRTSNTVGDVGQALACIVERDYSGCGFHQFVEAAKRATDGRNPGFPRPDAALAIFLFADEDDCSVSDANMFDSDPDIDNPESRLGPLSTYRCFEFGVECDPDEPRITGKKADCRSRQDSPYMPSIPDLRAHFATLKSRPELVSFFSFAGPGEPVEVVRRDDGELDLANVCLTGPWGQHGPTPRLNELMEGPLGLENASQCQISYGSDLGEMGQSLLEHLDSLSCVSGPVLDTSDAPGIQPRCVVTQVLRMGAPDEARAELSACGGNTVPCYRFEADETCDSGSRLLIDGAGGLSMGATVLATCDGA